MTGVRTWSGRGVVVEKIGIMPLRGVDFARMPSAIRLYSFVLLHCTNTLRMPSEFFLPLLPLVFSVRPNGSR